MNGEPKPLEDLRILAAVGGLTFGVELDGGFRGHPAAARSEKHSHASFEVLLVGRGEGELMVGQTGTTLRPGACIVLREGVYHSLYGRSPDFARGDFRFYLLPGGASGHAPPEGAAAALGRMPDWLIFYGEDVPALWARIARELERSSPWGLWAAEHLFALLILAVLREIAPSRANEELKPDADRPSDEKRRLIIEKFFDRYGEALTADRLAGLLYVSRRQLNRIMRELYGVAFKQKLLDIRVEVAKELLTGTGAPISEIARSVGYESAKSFHGVFVKKTGMTPREFRAAHGPPPAKPRRRKPGF